MIKKKNINFTEKKFGQFIFKELSYILLNFSKNKKLKSDIINNLNNYYCWSLHQLNYNSSLKMPKLFLSATMGSPFNRIMAINVIKNNGKVIVFDHGIGAGFTKHTSGRILLDLAYSTKFITYNKIMVEGVKENLNFLKKK